MGGIKEKIENKVEEIVYKKAKEEIEATARGYLNSMVEAAFSFFGWEETQAHKITRLSKEIQEKDDILLNDNVIGIVELFTMNYVNAAATIAGVSIPEEESSESDEKEK